MSMRIKVDIAKFKEQLRATADELNQATRPAAQAGVRRLSTTRKAACSGIDCVAQVLWIACGIWPVQTGHAARFDLSGVFKDNSFRDVSTYHVSWNADKAPYGAMVEFGTSRAPAHSFIGAAVKETRQQVKEAMKQRFIEEVSKK